MDEFVALFSDRARALRHSSSLSQEEVAHRAGTHVTYLSGIEREKRNPSIRNVHRLAVALGVPTRELVNFPEPKK